MKNVIRILRTRSGSDRRGQVRADRRGTVTVFVAVWLLVIFGLAAVGVDGGFWYMQRGEQQNAADMAAYAGVAQLAAAYSDGLTLTNGSIPAGVTASTTGIEGAAQLIAGANGFTSGQNGSTVTVNWPPAPGSGSFAGDPSAVEVIVSKPAPMLFARLIQAFAGVNTQRVGVRAVARYSDWTSKACILTLKEQLKITGTPNIQAPDCALSSDKPGPKSIYLNGTPIINVNTLTSNGECYNCDPTPTTGNVSLTYAVQPYHLYIPDPFAALDAALTTYEASFPATTGKVQITTAGDYTLSPGGYQGIKITNSGANVTLQPGLYVLGNTGLDIEGGNVSCSACTFVFMGKQSVTINSTGTVQLSAPMVAPTYNGVSYPELKGMLFYGPLSGSPYGPTINGSSTSYFQGAVYFPNSDMTLNGTSGVNSAMGTSCLLAVARGITINGTNTTNLDTTDCGSFGLPSVYTKYVQLVE